MRQQAPLLSNYSDTIHHGFFEMQTPDGDSLSAAYIEAEDEGVVTQRRERMVKTMTQKNVPLLTLKQVHGTNVITVSEPWQLGEAPQADGLVTNRKGLALGVLTADCGPLLFTDPENAVIAACHAGWKGAMGGIIENTLDAMETLGAKRSQVQAVLGPTIQQQSYEVGPEFPFTVLKPPYSYNQFFLPSSKPLHHLFDLPAYIREILISAKVKSFQDLGTNTFTGNYYSRRRTVSQNLPFSKKCNLSAIALV